MWLEKFVLQMEELLLGYRSVQAALMSGQRRLVRLLMDREHKDLARLALDRGVEVNRVSKAALERAAKGRKDQGVALACGPRPIPKVTALARSSWKQQQLAGAASSKELGSLTPGDVKTALERWLQDAEEEEVEERQQQQHDKKTVLQMSRPVVCGLWRVHDPQNLGAICRSALYFNLQQVVLSEAKSGTLSKVTSAVSSASAGAAEFVPIAQAVSFLEFLRESRQNGWIVVGTESGVADVPKVAPEELARLPGPLILVMGNEGEGIPREMARECDYNCIIDRKKNDFALSDNLDSLNVGVAAGILFFNATRNDKT